MELLHILQVKPLACKETLVTCAFIAAENAMAINKKIFFIIFLSFKIDLKKPPRLPGGLCGENDKVNYFPQFLHVQLSPQLQFSQVQAGLSHFCLSFKGV